MEQLLLVSLAGAMCAGVIALFRAAGARRVPARAFGVLWDAAALRFLLPLFLPGAQGGIGSAAQKIMQPAAAATTPMGQDSVGILEIIWICGAAAVAGILLFQCARECHQIRHAEPMSSAGRALCMRLVPETGRAELLVSGTAHTAFAAGLFRRRIVLPQDFSDWSRDTLRCVLTHEQTHVRHADNLRRILHLAALCVHWFNPLAWLLCILADRDTESACDAAAVKVLGIAERGAYAGALVDLAELQMRGSVVGVGFGSSGVARRVMGVLHPARWTKGRAAAVALAAAAVATAFFGSAGAVDAEKSMAVSYTTVQTVGDALPADYSVLVVDVDSGIVRDAAGKVVAELVEGEYRTIDLPDGSRQTVRVWRGDDGTSFTTGPETPTS